MLGSLLLLIVVLAGCAGDVAEQGEIQKFSEVLSDILPTAKKQENEWRNNLLAKASGTANSLSEITVGTPTQIKAAKAKQDAIKTELSAKVAEARKPLDEAEAKRDALTKPDPRGYYYPASSYQMKRCGSDGCGGICEEACNSDQVCYGNWCACVPDCRGRECGPDGCGGYCGKGSCGENAACNKEGVCVDHETFTSECKPNCRSNLSIYVETTQSKPKISRWQRTDTTSRNSNAYRRWSSPDELSTYLDNLKTKSAAHASELARLANIATQIAEQEGIENTQKSEGESLKAKSVETAKNIQAQTMAYFKARGDKEKAEQLKTAIDELKASQKETRTALSENAKSLRTTRAEIRKLKGEQRKASKTITRLQKAKGKLDAESAVMTEELATWQRSELEAANKVVDEASAAFQAAREKLEAEYKERLEKARAQLKALLEPAFPSNIVPIWNGNSPTTAAASLPISIGKNSRLSGYVTRLKTTANAYRKDLSSLSDGGSAHLLRPTRGKHEPID